MTEVQAESVQFLEPKSGGAGSGGYSGGGNSGGQYYGGAKMIRIHLEMNQVKIHMAIKTTKIVIREIASMMTHLRTMVNRSTSPMMICHSN